MSDTFICNGTQKSLCTVYGSNGSKQSEAPSESALSRAVDRDRKWKQSSKDRICSWGCGRAVLCGGISQASCEKYGNNGTHKHLRPPEEEVKELVKELKKEKNRKRTEVSRANRSPSKRNAEQENDRKRKEVSRADRSPSKRAAEQENDRKRKKVSRADRSPSKKTADQEKARIGMAKLRDASSPSGKKQQADFSTPCLTCLEDEQKITLEGFEHNAETAALAVHFNTGTYHWRDAYTLLEPGFNPNGEDGKRMVEGLCQRVRGQRASADRIKTLMTEFFESQGRGWRQSDGKQEFLPGVSRDAGMPACGCCGYRNLDVTRHLKYHRMSLANLDILKLSNEEAAQHRWVPTSSFSIEHSSLLTVFTFHLHLLPGKGFETPGSMPACLVTVRGRRGCLRFGSSSESTPRGRIAMTTTTFILNLWRKSMPRTRRKTRRTVTARALPLIFTTTRLAHMR